MRGAESLRFKKRINEHLKQIEALPNVKGYQSVKLAAPVAQEFKSRLMSPKHIYNITGKNSGIVALKGRNFGEETQRTSSAAQETPKLTKKH
jgi:hypothetical protein